MAASSTNRRAQQRLPCLGHLARSPDEVVQPHRRGANVSSPDVGAPPARRHARTWLGPVTLASFVAAAALLVGVTGVRSASGLGDAVASAGATTPFVLVAIYGACVLAPVPRNVLSAATGALIGFWWGVPVAYAGSLLGALTAFWLARRLGRDAVEQWNGPRMRSLDARLSRQGFVTVLVARMFPLVPFTAFNYAAGLSSIRARNYQAGTILGAMPGTVAYVAVGAYAVSLPWVWLAALSAAALLAVTVRRPLQRWRLDRSI